MKGRALGLLAVLGLLAPAGFLAYSASVAGPGFPLDDAWIHQTYARNLVQFREWSFFPGQRSAGSTSPLWTLLLAAGYTLGANHLWWTFGLGCVLLLVNAFFAAMLGQRLFLRSESTGGKGGVQSAGDQRRQVAERGSAKGSWIPSGIRQGLSPWLFTALAVLLEWHLVWAGLSGMETLLFSALVLVVLLSLDPPARHQINPLTTGLLIGASVAVRPDGLSLLLPAAAGLILGAWEDRRRRRALLRDVALLLLGLGATLGPYLAFNLWLGGAPWPNTLFAKQAEYEAYLKLPALTRMARLLLTPFVGGQFLLIPGLAAAAWGWFRMRSWKKLLPLMWALSFVGLYAVRLPVTYQHGRYLMPAIPVFLLVGLGGTLGWVVAHRRTPAGRVLGGAWIGSAALVELAFLGLGARAYAHDVGFIETNLVPAARWVGANVSPEELLAAHDIGALGYFAPRPLLDLAGLVSPEVIPIIRDESKLAQWLDERGVAYLLVFPDWYPSLIASPQAVPLHEFPGDFAPESIGHPVLYTWRPSTELGNP